MISVQAAQNLANSKQAAVYLQDRAEQAGLGRWQLLFYNLLHDFIRNPAASLSTERFHDRLQPE